MNYLDVAVGVVMKGNRTFVCLRPEEKHQGGKWEFPGGKVEASESPQQALCRELKEEIAIQVNGAEELLVIEHQYVEKCVRLHVFIVADFEGDPVGNEGQKGHWVSVSSLQPNDFPQANKIIITKLQSMMVN